MPENQRRILELLKDKKITVEEAERLLALAGEPERRGLPPGATAEKKSPPKYLRVVVQPAEGAPGGERVNVRVPMNLIRAGMKLTSLIPPMVAAKVQEAMKEEGVNFDMRNFKPEDIEELIEALSDMEINVESNEHGEKVHVFVE
ncbi:MAG: hypothetical protein HYX80_09005 [Chloroflexi bacterium]|nr:hypothetical protein [Chloroflexota bacterium]